MLSNLLFSKLLLITCLVQLMMGFTLTPASTKRSNKKVKSAENPRQKLTPPKRIKCDLLIVGAGVTGAAAAFIAAKYTDLKRIVIIEKFDAPGTVNSNDTSNAQTLHTGDTETNYGLKKALKIRFASWLIRSFIKNKLEGDVFQTVNGMVIGVGKKECDLLRARHKEFQPYYPDLQLIYGIPNQPDATSPILIGELETEVMSGRKKTGRDDICALYTPDRICMNYRRLAEELIKDAKAIKGKKVEVYYNSPLTDIWPATEGYGIETENGMIIEAGVVEFAAGAYSLSYAHRLGYAMRLALLNVAGNFYWLLRKALGKIYGVQVEGIPFAAFHIDLNMVSGRSQLGPTTQIILEMIRHRPETFPDYMRTPLFSTLDGWKAFYRTIRKNHLALYGLKNMIFEFVPVLGKYLVLLEARKIFPDLGYWELGLEEGHGGSRPQIIDLDADNPLIMGDYNIVGWRIIFNTTPSPGASVCLKNAFRDILRVVKFYKGKFKFDLEKFKADFEVTDDDIATAFAE